MHNILVFIKSFIERLYDNQYTTALPFVFNINSKYNVTRDKKIIQFYRQKS